LDELSKETDIPFGISSDIITREQWFALAQHKDGEANSVPNLHLTQYLCGVIRADGKHYYAVEAIYHKFLGKRECDTPVGIDAKQKDDLIRERILDWPFNFEQTLAFITGVNKTLPAQDWRKMQNRMEPLSLHYCTQKLMHLILHMSP
jgi:hypothetical protein